MTLSKTHGSIALMASVIGWAAVTSIFLVLFYQHLQVNWPSNYFGPREVLAQYVSRGAIRYIVFRFTPPYVAFVLVGIYAAQPQASVVATAITYSALSSGLSIRSSVVGAHGGVRLTLQRAAVLFVNVVGLAACAWAAIATLPLISSAAPPLSDVVANIIATLIAAVLAIAYFRSTGSNIDTYQESADNLPHELETEIQSAAIDHCVDPKLAIAIARTENVQRPRWFRRLERVFSRLNPRGSYGLFQVSGHGPVSDIASCRIALSSIAGTYPIIGSYGDAVGWSIRQAAELHNPDHNFAESVAIAYWSTHIDPIGATENKAPDRRPLAEVWAVGRFGGRMQARGTFWSPTESVEIELRDFQGVLLNSITPVVIHNDQGRSSWKVDLPANTLVFSLVSSSAMGDCFTREEVRVDLSEQEVIRDLSLA